MKRYSPKDIEPKWQKIWDETKVYNADLSSDKTKYIAMSMFNYPSGDLHIGHAMNYTISDVKARFKRQQGYESYHPVGWDSFGLPAENRAIKDGLSPQELMARLIPDYRKAYKAMGWSNDWDKEISTHSPEYYKWTQWVFSEMFRNGLAYQDARMQWWCTKCQTVLANEQVIDGKCWRHESKDDPIVEKKEVKQWFFKITEYADELLEAIDDLDWTESVKLAQKNWIGKSVGAEITFKVCHPELDSGSRDTARSFIMGQKNISTKDIEDLGGVVSKTTESGSLCVSFPLKSAPDFEKLIIEKMEPGFWNEYIGDEIVFVFKHKDGKIERFVLGDDTEEAIRRLGQSFNNQEDDSSVRVIDWLKDNEWYKDWIPNRVEDDSNEITVFTTRADTLFGATFLVVAPESDIVAKITSESQKQAVEDYVKSSTKKTEIERQAAKDKTGVFTGSYAVNPVNNEKIPIWVADYVLSGYGTGAIMAVPAHDERDFEFATKFKIPIIQVIRPCEDDPNNPPAPGLEVIERDTVVVHLHDKSTGKYALLNWHGTLEGITTAIMGGVEEGQTPAEAALAEISEEAGLSNVTIVKESPWITGARYFASHKNQNRKSLTHAFIATVENTDGQKDVSDYEKKTHTLVWVDKEDVLESLIPQEQKLIWSQLQNTTALTGEGEMINSGLYDGLDSSVARENILADLVKDGQATEKVNYKMRDWSVSRQRYWGAPIPIVNCERCGTVLIPDEDLPVVLPELTDFQPSGDGRSALARATDWLKTTCPDCGGEAERETDTLDTYICSSWYMLRYFDPHNQNKIFDSEIDNRWMPIDFYNGGDHATAHMLYARFVTRFFSKIGLVKNPEPFKQFLFNGKVRASDGSAFSKTLGNGIDPLEIIDSGYGADALRMYLMFAAPLEFNARWDAQGVPGTHRFLVRLWNLVQEYIEAEAVEAKQEVKDALKVSSATMIKKVTRDIEENRYNTAIAASMAGLNSLYKIKPDSLSKSDDWKLALEAVVACVAPFAPHIADELWQQLGHDTSVHKDSWPKLDEASLQTSEAKIVVQVNGKVRSTIMAPSDSDEASVAELAKADEKVAVFLKNEQIKKTILVPNKLINFVV